MVNEVFWSLLCFKDWSYINYNSSFQVSYFMVIFLGFKDNIAGEVFQISFYLISLYRSSCLQIFFKTGALKKSRNIQRKTPMLESLFNKAAGLKSCNFVKKKALAHMFSCEYCKIFKNIFLWNTSGGCFCLWFNRDMRLFETVVFIIIIS